MTLTGNRHPLARPEFELGAAPLERRMERMILALGIDALRQKALDARIAGQHDARSAQYHRWLTPDTFGREFGVSENDLAQIVTWLRSHGLEVEEIARGRRSLQFSGTVAQVEAAFHTQMRAYYVDGEMHYANATDPEIPKALARVVQGVVALHDFRTKPTLAAVRPLPVPQMTTGGGTHYMAPADFAAIYDVAPLYQNAIDGTGQSVAVVARCNIHLSDVQAFRSYFGLPANSPNVIVNGTDPGIVSNGEETEADLDVEWAGAVAKNATVQFVVSASTGSSDGAYLSAQYIVNNNVAPVMTMSFGLCENAMGSSGNSFLNSLWQQAAAQGITVLVSSGDSGAAGCDAASAGTAVHGPAVSGLCSTPYNVCVGGTQFSESSNASSYWSATSDPTTKASALQYIPETVWNESGSMPGGSGLWSAGGGVSSVYAKPSWQTGPGVPADGKRDVPDVSLTAAGHDGYLVYMNGGLYAVAGTSASAPSFASLMALAVQKTGARQGNPNPTLYSLASSQQSGGAAVFHDTTTGNNSVPGVTGFNAGVGYDPATGLGSVDAALLINNWGGTSTPNLQVNPSSPGILVAQGASGGVMVTVGVSGGFSSMVVLSAAGLPAGVTASFSPASLPAPGSGTSTLTLNAGSQVAPGIYTVQITANGGSVSQSSPLTLTVTAPASFTLGLSAGSVSMKQGGSVAALVSVSVAGGFSSAVALSVAGLPAGVTAAFVPAGFAAPGAGSSLMMLTAGAQAAAGNYTLQVSAAGGGATQSLPLALMVTPQPGFTLSETTGSITMAQGASGTVGISVSVSGGFSSKMSLSVTGQPAGMTLKLSSASFAAPGSGTSTLTVSAGTLTAAGSYTLQITASGGGLAATLPLSVTVVPPPNFTISASTAPVSLVQGGTAAVTLTINGTNGFNSAVALSASGLPSGVTASFSPASLAAPGSGASVLTLSAATGALAGARAVTIQATGGNVTKTATLTVTVIPPPSFTLSSSPASTTVLVGRTAAVNLNVSATNGFNSTVALSASGAPSGVTASFSPASLAAPGSGASVLTLSANPSTPTGKYTIGVTATGGAVTKTVSLVVTVSPPPNFTLSQSAASASVTRGSSTLLYVTVTGTGGFNSSVALTASGLPAGVTASFSPASLVGSGTHSSALKLVASSSAAAGASSTVTITATGGGITNTVPVAVTVK